MSELTRILSAALVLMMSGCGGFVSFPNARLSAGDASLTISGLLAKPTGEGPFPALVLLHTCGGLQPHVTKHWPEYLTGLGYVALSVDSFGSRGIRRCSTEVARDHGERTKDAYGALEYLASLPFVDKGRIGVMGFSMGGNDIDYFVGRKFKTPSGLNFKVAVSVYGACRDLQQYTETIPTAVIIGDRENEDRLMPCKKLAEKSLPSIKIYVLPGAYHAFDNENITSVSPDTGGNPRLYSAEATQRAREITKAFLAQHLGK